MNFNELDVFFRSIEKEDTKVLKNDKFYIIRIDGKCFSKFTEKHFIKPFDYRFQKLMRVSVERLVKEFENNITFAYFQSDEISFLLSNKTENLKDRKLLSHIPSAFSSIFNQESGLNEIAIFDARLIELSDVEEVKKYFLWRMLDCQRNSLNTFVYWSMINEGDSKKRASKSLETMKKANKIAYNTSNYQNWDSLPSVCKNGEIASFRHTLKEGFNPITKQFVMTPRRVWWSRSVNDISALFDGLNEALKDRK